MGPVKVYNKGKRPIVWKSTLRGREAIHPGKFELFGAELAKQIIDKFDDAVSEADFKKLKAPKKEQERKAPKDD